jgi:hypothetical protein
MRQLRNITTALAALMLLAACTNDNSPAQASSSAAERGSDAGASAFDAGYAYEMLGDAHLYGPGRWGVAALGDPDAPVAVLDVPEGFQGRESWAWTDNQGPGEFAQLASWTPTRVPEDPCKPEKSRPLGPTVVDLVRALSSQKRTTTTDPISVRVDDHSGMYVELTTPDRFDYKSCGPDGMQIWQTGTTDPRAFDEPVIDRYWIMDVDGHRVVISAMTNRVATSETVELITGVAETVTFVEAK